MEVKFKMDIYKQKILDKAYKRCEERNLEPERRIDRTTMGEKEFEELLEKKEFLLGSARPFMEKIYKFMEDKSFLVSLADENARVIEVVGETDIKNTCVRKGIDWSESNAGVNAISLALNEARAVQVTGNEHYCNELKIWGCSACPIWLNGVVIGVISITGPKEKIYPHTLGMVVAVSYAIENILYVKEKNNQLIVKQNFQDAIVEAVNDGMIIIDKNGVITYMNSEAADILYVNRNTSIGKHISDIVNFNPMILEVLKTGVGYVEKELIVRNPTGAIMHLQKTAYPIKDEEGNVAGVVDTFRRIKKVKKMVNDMVGSYAKFTFEDIIGNDNNEKFIETLKMARIASQSTSNVLIQGESGTGKELFANAIHNASTRAGQPFVTLNCSGIPRQLLEGELFGVERKYGTENFIEGRPGKFELANGGTLFINEVSELPLDLQVKLMKAIQDKRISRMGGENVFDVNVRLICATNKDLSELCRDGSFRQDLYYRLDVLGIKTTPLREQKDSLDKLVKHIIAMMSKKLGKDVLSIDESAMNILRQYDWPGNVRELENALERAVNVCEGTRIMQQHIPSYINMTIKDGDGTDKSGSSAVNNYETLENLEKKHIITVTRYTKGNISKAADILGVSRNTLYNKLKKYEIEI
ncbi:hypothetical protein B5E58_09240 [Tyzzerella sp. An114]|nr:hypothetical protein B5E58_09240 [Tyzzerella sp. An114]